MTAHAKVEPSGATVSYETLRAIDGECWSLHHQVRILAFLIESVEKDLQALQPHLRVNVMALTNLAHAQHQAFEITGTSNRLREAVDGLV